jgi:hypothetical protein
MLRSIFGIILGILVGGIVVGLIELPGYFIHPPPPGFDMSDPEAMKSHFAKAPLAALAGVGIAWTVGPFVAAWLAATIARRACLVHALIVGAFFLLMDVLNLLSFPHPAWLAAIGVVAPGLAAWLGGVLAQRMSSPRPPGPQPYDMREKNMAC